VKSATVVSDLEGIQDGKEKIYEVAQTEADLDLMDEDDKLIVLPLMPVFHQRVQEDLTAIDLSRALVVLESFDEELYGRRVYVEGMDSEVEGHVVVAVEQGHGRVFVGRELIVGTLAGYRLPQETVVVDVQDVGLGNLSREDTLLKLELDQVDDLSAVDYSSRSLLRLTVNQLEPHSMVQIEDLERMEHEMVKVPDELHD